MIETMPESNLEGALEQKQFQKEQLLQKLQFLTSMPTVEISYDINLKQAEQIKLAKFGLYSLTRDLMYYERKYGNSEL